MDKWKAMSKFANQMGGTSAALGYMAGGLDPGPKPEEATGMAMSGMLGSGTKDLANFFNPDRSDGFFGAVSSRGGSLQSRYGGTAMIEARQGGVQSPFNAFRNALSAAGHQMMNLGDVNPAGEGISGGK